MGWLVGFLLVAGIAALFSVSWQLFSLGATDPAVLGQKGDFFGGFLNPILTFLGFIGVLITIHLSREAMRVQSEESKSQRAAARLQTFEAAFFEMLSLHNDIVSSINIERKIGKFDPGTWSLTPKEFRIQQLQGRAAFEKIADDVVESCRPTLIRDGEQDDKLTAFEIAYAEFWRGYRQHLGHYYRVLFNIVRFVDESEFSGDPKYMRFVRAQLSDYELVLLLYNCISIHGQAFKKYAEKYSLFDNFPYDLDEGGENNFAAEYFSTNAFSSATGRHLRSKGQEAQV